MFNYYLVNTNEQWKDDNTKCNKNFPGIKREISPNAIMEPPREMYLKKKNMDVQNLSADYVLKVRL